MREISIGCGSREQLGGLLGELQKQHDDGFEPEVQIRGNGGPSLRLRFVNENDPDITEPLVDYYEGS